MARKKRIEHVLIVDDEKVVRKGISRALANRNIRATEALNGKEAIAHLKTREFDLILLDIKMEDMDGTEILQQIRRSDPEAKVVMITGYPTIATAVHCTKLGALDYLTKPFSLDDLDAALSKVHSGKSVKRESFAIQTDIKQDPTKRLIVGQSPPMKKIFEKMGEEQRFEEEYKSSLKEGVESWGYGKVLARSLRQKAFSDYDKGDLAGAIGSFKKMLKIYQQIDDINGQVPALFSLGILHEESGDAQKGQEFFKRVLSINPNHIQAREKIRPEN